MEAIEKKMAALLEYIETSIAKAERAARADERSKLKNFVWWCEDCDTPRACDANGGGYYSTVDCNEMGGRGLVLCAKCCERWDAGADLRAKQRAEVAP